MAQSTNSVGYFQETEGQSSSMRLMSFLVIAIVLGIFIVANAVQLKISFLNNSPVNMVDISTNCLWALVFAFFAKMGQKGIENMEQITDMIGKIAESIVKIKSISNKTGE